MKVTDHSHHYSLRRQLSTLGFLSTSPDSSDTEAVLDDDETRQPASVTMCDMSDVCEGLDAQFTTRLTAFIKRVLESRLLSAVTRLNDVHRKCLNVMIDSTFVAANYVTWTQARLKYPREQEVRHCTVNGLLFVCILCYSGSCGSAVERQFLTSVLSTSCTSKGPRATLHN